MNRNEFLSHLRSHSDRHLTLRLPDGGRVPAHFHITEVGHVTRRFVDCGGIRRVHETCLLQTWVHDDVEHRLPAGKLAGIFDKAGDVLGKLDLPLEFEVELGTAARFGVGGASIVDGKLEFALSAQHTDCLARGVCLPEGCDAGNAAALDVPGQSSGCVPGGGCC